MRMTAGVCLQRWVHAAVLCAAVASLVLTIFADNAAAMTKAALVYVNREYGFRFDLPASWKGYKILTKNETAVSHGPGASDETKEGYVVVSIRHPLWTEANPRQDIPIMVFTHEQWEQIQQEKLIVSAAPIPPSELGRNRRYVFALPPRYNFAFPTGYEEVETILQGKPLRGF